MQSRACPPARGLKVALSGLFDDDFGEQFLLATTPTCLPMLSGWTDSINKDEIIVAKAAALRDHVCHECLASAGRGSRLSLLLVLDSEFEHFDEALLKHAKVACVTVPSALERHAAVIRTLNITQMTDYQEQIETENKLLHALEQSDYIEILDDDDNSAIFDYRDAEYWFSLNGVLGFGQQTVLPTGEVSVLAAPSGEYGQHRPFCFNGKLALTGGVLVHQGRDEIPRTETLALYSELDALRESKVIAEVTDGIIGRVVATSSAAKPVEQALDRLFSIDNRYRMIYEVGFGTNVQASPLLHDNTVCEERHPGIHFGLGLGGFTDFHIDLLCPSLGVRGCKADGTSLVKIF
jgi:hypothetical protein